MNTKLAVAIFIGIITTLLGLLWFLQGSGLVHIKPILCFADCEPITGKSLQWQIMGIVAFTAGLLIAHTSLKRLKRQK